MSSLYAAMTGIGDRVRAIIRSPDDVFEAGTSGPNAGSNGFALARRINVNRNATLSKVPATSPDEIIVKIQERIAAIMAAKFNDAQKIERPVAETSDGKTGERRLYLVHPEGEENNTPDLAGRIDEVLSSRAVAKINRA